MVALRTFNTNGNFPMHKKDLNRGEKKNVQIQMFFTLLNKMGFFFNSLLKGSLGFFYGSSVKI